MGCDLKPKHAEEASSSTDKEWEFTVRLKSEDFEDEYGEFLYAASYDEATEKILVSIKDALDEYFLHTVFIKLEKGTIIYV